MKIYLPGYYLRSLRNQPLVEINADDISSTLQFHQIEVQQSRKRKNLKLFEELSNHKKLLPEEKNNLKTEAIGVPLVQEFIRDLGPSEEDVGIALSCKSKDEGSYLNGQTNSNLYESDTYSSIKNCVFPQPSPVKTQENQRVISINSSSSSYSYPAFYSTSESHLPKAFKAKLKKNLINSALKTPKINPVKITNLSYSQPSSPKTPLVRSIICATPRLQKSNNLSTPSFCQYVAFTPMLNEAVKLLDCIPERCDENVDLLNIIDDDTKPVELVDKELDFYNEVNDGNVVDYVLNIVNDYPIQEKQQFQKVPRVDFTKKRKCFRAKPVFLEESEVYKEQKRQKDKERRKKRKELFEKKSPLGTRRSKRKLRPPPC